jgi:ribonuclease HII
MSHWLIGLDEAGYGPNLGPLTIAGCSWLIESNQPDLYQALRAGVKREAKPTDSRLQIADSKQVYQQRKLRSLELPVLAACYAIDQSLPRNFAQLIEGLAPAPHVQQPKEDPLNQDWSSFELPCACSVDEVLQAGEQFQRTCQEAGVRLTGLICRTIFPGEYNQLLVQHGNKGTLLSTQTLEIAGLFLNSCGDHPLQFVFDKHGGRSRYGPLIQQLMTDELVLVETESLSSSRYHFRQGDRKVNLAFNAGGENCLATALSSMIAKYCREISMILWNQFWLSELPLLKPTQGYPVDARRFMKEIEETRQALQFPKESLWRLK